jgi:acetolactate synthase I/II/III large subunit
MRVCDWIADYLKSIGVERVHGLMGGGASGLNDGFIKQDMPYICYHHEQGAGHAATAESKFTGKLAVVNPTTGCAGTNCATSVLNAWQDSVPVLFLSGNVRLDTCSGHINQQKHINIRKYGIQEHHVVDTYRSMTKFAHFIDRVEDVAYIIQEAIHIATSSRPGPVWIDIPGNIQVAEMPNNYREFKPTVLTKPPADFSAITYAVNRAERPLILAGYGIRQSDTVKLFNEFIEKYQIPYVSTYGARDYTSNDHPLSIGAVGIKGSRAGNFALQNADLLLVLGSSLGGSVIGYDPAQFSPVSYKIVVDLDINELKKDIVKIDEKYNVSLEKFFKGML